MILPTFIIALMILIPSAYAIPAEFLENKLPWIKDQHFGWEYFQGNVGEFPESFKRGSSRTNAFVHTTSYTEWNSTQIPSVICQFQITKMNSTAFLIMNKSWIKEGEQSDLLLNHEKKHFDITEIHNRMVESELLFKIIPCSDGIYDKKKIDGIIEKLKNTILNKDQSIQDKYDADTGDGNPIHPMQKKWNSKIDSDLQKYYIRNTDFSNESIPEHTIGVNYEKRVCKMGWDVVQKSSNMKLYCITPAVAEKLVEQNWGEIISFPRHWY